MTPYSRSVRKQPDSFVRRANLAKETREFGASDSPTAADNLMDVLLNAFMVLKTELKNSK